MIAGHVVEETNGFRARVKSFDPIRNTIPRKPRTLAVTSSLPDYKGRWLADASTSILEDKMVNLDANIIARKKTGFKDMVLFKSPAYGKVLIFDGNTQLTEKDGFVYYEMSSHVPLCCHPEPKDILIVGGLDGSWLAREIFKHPSVERVVHLEQDTEMVDFLQANFHAPNFDVHNPKFEYCDKDPKEYLKHCYEEFDIIITDCTAPSPETDGLFGDSYYELVKQALKPNGITITQSWGIWVELEPPTDVLKGNMRWARNLFPSVSYYMVAMPSITSGQAGNIICSKAEGVDFSNPARVLDNETLTNWKLKFYNPEVHKAAFALPQFAKEALSRSAYSPVSSPEDPDFWQ